MKKIIASLFLLAFLASCGSSTDNVNLTKLEGKGFSLQVPKAWTAVDEKSLPKPKNGTVVAALTSTDVSNGFANNLLILKDTLQNADNSMTSRKYSVVNAALTNGNYKEYAKLSDTTIKFSDNDEGLITTFEAKYNTDTPKQKFMQAAKICGKDVYLMTIALAYSTSDTSKYQDIFSSFECSK